MLHYYPIISEIQRIYVYETYTRLYLIGSDYKETKFRILKIDRTEEKDLIIHEEEVSYNFEEIKELLQMVDLGNRTKVALKNQNKLSKNISAFGIIGFVKFLFGYYVILITKKNKVGFIGHHNIYKIEDTYMLYIPNNQQPLQNPEEQNYSYDLTHSLQYNFSILKQKEFFERLIEKDAAKLNNKNVIGYKVKPCWQYVWNRHLLTPWHHKVHFDWCIHIIHGFLKQTIISVFGQDIVLTLLARRSSFYAGTRYLKRGISLIGGYTANSVETEQILENLAESMSYSSYVQFRGSIPTFWCQESSKMVPKPPILLNNTDPFCLAPGTHFHRLMKRYGTPIIVLNLAKNRETKRGEGILTEEFINSICYLNQFLPLRHKILYQGFDMARMNRNKSIDVIKKLEEICYDYIIKTDIFLATISCSLSTIKCMSRQQKGVIRSNCVDCLDRTNTAQFVIGKCALTLQLEALGVLDEQDLETYSDINCGEMDNLTRNGGRCRKLTFDSDIIRMLEDLYEEQGDVLAMQYGGSQLVHRVDTYRKISPSWTYHSRDMMQTFSRYYSNAFSDAEKQDAINLFLGAYVPSIHYPPAIWEMTNDFHLHNSSQAQFIDNFVNLSEIPAKDSKDRSFCKWYDKSVLECLPMPYEQVKLDPNDIQIEYMKNFHENQRIDSYYDFYKPYEYSSFESLFFLNAVNTIRDYMPTNSKQYSPFISRRLIQPHHSFSFVEIGPALTVIAKDNQETLNNNETEYVILSSTGNDNNLAVINDKKLIKNGVGPFCPLQSLTSEDENLYKAYVRIFEEICFIRQKPNKITDSMTAIDNDRIPIMLNSLVPSTKSYPILHISDETPHKNTCLNVEIQNLSPFSLLTYSESTRLCQNDGLVFLNLHPSVSSKSCYEDYLKNIYC
ncbi:polyphosphoinositide phosphatase-like isoform X3 [Gordionus sp. m RMFG-2023]|uniref:polyphosphoinositide phosphatase-like isoform X3 n=1 Tax=Gordionus sp. m RMFG-2023 TaxID=3053472 RepID=UPI0031FBE2E3